MARFRHTDLIVFAETLLVRGGLEAGPSRVVAEILVEGDLLGHDTHGLALLAGYLADLESGAIAKTGAPRVIADFPAALTWDGCRLPGPWLVTQALELAMDRAARAGTCTVVIRRSGHIGCLAAYLRRATDRGMMVLLSSSNPATQTVAPHGGRRSVFSPNPIAAAWPTEGDPVMIDVSTSITSNAMAARLNKAKRPMPGAWAIDATGQPTMDPAALFTDPPGSLLPIGGADHGHKGFALGLLVEALTGGLAGHGRSDAKEPGGATVFLQVFDPALFGGADEFARQTGHLAAACRATPPRPGFERVRLPGESGLRRRADQLARGIELHSSILPALFPWAAKRGVSTPDASA